MTPTVDPDRMLRLLCVLEENIHARGWDGPPQACVLYDQSDEATAEVFDNVLGELPGATAYADSYATRPYIPTEVLSSNAIRMLFVHSLDVAGFLSDSGGFAEDVLLVLRQPGFLGTALMFESWATRVTGGEIEQRLAEPFPEPVAEMKGKFERRYLLAADIDGRVYTVTRTNGQDAVSRRTSLPGDPEAPEPLVVGGCALESVCRVTAAVAKQPPVEVSFFPSVWRQTLHNLPRADLLERPSEELKDAG